MPDAFPVAFNAHDRFLVTAGGRIVVITQDGSVFGHDVNGTTVGPAFAFDGSKVAFNGPADRFVVASGNRLVVITQDGSVFGHDVSGTTIGSPFPFRGSKVAFNGPADRFVAAMADLLLVTTYTGGAFAHRVVGDEVLPAQPMNTVPPFPRTLQFRLRFFREHASTDGATGGANDEVFIGAVAADSAAVTVGPDGKPQVGLVNAPHVGDASANPVRNAWRQNPHVLASFDLHRPGDWPRSYTVTLLLVEEDSADLASAFTKLYEMVGAEVRQAIVKAATSSGAALAGAVLGSAVPGIGTVVGPAVGGLAGSAFDALVNAVREGLANDVFTPIPLVLTIDNPFAAGAHPAVGREQTLTVAERGAKYEILHDWHIVP